MLGRLQQLLLVVGGQEGQRRGHKIHQPARLLDVGGNRPQLVGERRRLGDNLLELRQSRCAPAPQRSSVAAGSTSSSVSTSATMNGSVCE